MKTDNCHTHNIFWTQAYGSYFKGKKILLGITGSIASIKSIDLVRLLKECGAEVRVILTKNASQFVTPLTIETLTGQPCLTDMWNDAHGTHHIDDARWADIFIILPASANTIAKISNGIADDLLTTEVLAFSGPLFLVPAMNPVMWSAQATQENVARIKSRKRNYIIGPIFGVTACKEEGEGRMVEPLNVIEHIATSLGRPANGKTALVSMGPTRSYYDPVRYLTNRSSGKMGAAIAFALCKRGYQVQIVTGPTSVPLPKSAQVTRVTDSHQMAAEVLDLFPESDLFVSTAAVLDFEFSATAEKKIKNSKTSTNISVKKTTDILYEAGKTKRKDQFILGFAAESDSLEKNALLKLKNKNCNAVFANAVEVKESDKGFESLTNAGLLLTNASGKKKVELSCKSKIELADEIIENLQLDKFFG